MMCTQSACEGLSRLTQTHWKRAKRHGDIVYPGDLALNVPGTVNGIRIPDDDTLRFSSESTERIR